MRRARLFGVAAILALSAFGPLDLAHAADPITGAGPTDSAVTMSWSQGLLGADNTTVVAPRDPHSPLSFLYPDFQNLKVTVSQTRSLVHEAVEVDWSGLFANGTNGGFLQIMQCYGDSTSGPAPEDCEFGTPANLLPSGLANASAGSRGGSVCRAGAVPSTTAPPVGAEDGSSAADGCDTREPSSTSHIDPTAGDPNNYSVPFMPAGTDQLVYQSGLSGFFDQFHTNEVQSATSGTDGTGQDFFQVLTATQAPGLGCGQIEANGQPRDCWLVIVPRGQFDANGFQIHGISPLVGNPNGSPLGKSLWDQRIQIHLGFAPLAQNCPIGSTKELETVGTGLVSHAVFSWLVALNANSNCSRLYAFTQVPEHTSTTQLAADTGAAGLAFTTIPIGSEVTRVGGGPATDTGPPLVYAPVATSAITFGFNINLPSTNGFDSMPVKLDPRLLAKVLTQSYRLDLPDFFASGNDPGPAWAQHNPLTLVNDPEFQKLNPTVLDGGAATSLAPLLTEDHSGVNQQVWQWILTDPAARAWLGGTPDEHGMVVNPNYQKLNLGANPIDSYPRADPTCFNTGVLGEKDPGRCSIQLLPYVNNLEDAASRVRAASDPLGPGWDPTALAPDGSTGWWSNATLEGPRTTFMWTITDSANLAAYGLVPAELCDAAGTNCVGPNSTSIGTAVANAKADGGGLLHVDPTAPGAGGYPLVDVTYAAVRTTQPTTALDQYATLIDYAAGPGQTAGVEPGQLPGGYLPLPASLRAQATAAAAALRAGTSPATGTTPATDNGTPSLPDNVSPAGTGNTPAAPGAASTSPTRQPGGTPSTSRQPALAARFTPGTAPGALRWILLVVVIAGAAGLIAGGALRWNGWRRLRR
ncbi:MAG TPA: hypothetical protein VF892_26385 [Pseudonocardiaceae bacterium]